MEQVSPDVIQNSEYSAWLEGLVRTVYDMEPTAIGVVMILEDGATLADYFKAGWMDRLMMAGTIQTDAMMTAVKANGEEIMDAWDVVEDEEEEEEIDAGDFVEPDEDGESDDG